MDRVEDLGWRIAKSWVRAGDKAMAMSYCLKSDICYRLQFGIWSLAKYKKVDEIYVRILRRITKNMKGFPGKALTGGKKQGGLGLETPTMHAHKRKLRIVLMGWTRGD